MIKSFNIDGLFGTMSMNVPLNEDGIRILIGENGLGKTTVLNILYYSLIKNFHKLLQYEFETVELVFSSGEKANLKQSDLQRIHREPNRPVPSSLVQQIMSAIPESDLMEITNLIQGTKLTRENFFRHPIFRKHLFDTSRHYPVSVIWSALCTLVDPSLSKRLAKFRDVIDANLSKLRILYFPTYRRIEEDLKNLNIEIDEESLRNPSQKLIQFGMDDVKNRFKAIQNDIQRLSSLGLSRISSEILSQLVKGAPRITKHQLDSMDPSNIQIILARVGNLLSGEDKDRIVKIITNKKLKQEDKFLVYFIQKLIEIYDQQKSLDEKIKSFVTVCNRYLSFSNKNLIYNESEVEFYIESKFFERKLLIEFLSRLSSGEKQIISLFSRIYLSEEGEKFIVLFDEPELSLSVYWQELLLPDVIKSGKIKNLIAATHSPFIYDNILNCCTNGLSEYTVVKPEE